MDAFGNTDPGGKAKETLVEQITQECAEVFGRIVCEHKRAVFSVAYGKLQNTHDAEDVMQDVFVEAYRNYNRLRNPKKIRAWLHKATIYRCKDHVRKAVRRGRRERIFADSVSNNPSTDSRAEKERRDTVIEAIGSLPEKYRVIIMLKHFARLSYTEISEMTGLGKPAINNRLRAARKKLRDILIEMGEGVD